VIHIVTILKELAQLQAPPRYEMTSMDSRKQLFSRPATSLVVALLSSTFMTPAFAGCQQASLRMLNCTGEVNPIVPTHQTTRITVSDLTQDMTNAGGAEAYIDVVGTASGLQDDEDKHFQAEDSDTGDRHQYGIAASGYSAYNRTIDLTLDNGHSLDSNSGAIKHHSTGAHGGKGQNHGGGGTQRGEFGGTGGAGGAITLNVSGNEVSGIGAKVSGQNNPTLDLQTTGATGGDGGRGYHHFIAHHGYGGRGGQGGKGGNIHVDFNGDAHVTANNSQRHGVAILSQGGMGGDGGEGESGNKGIGGAGGTGGDGGAINVAATSKENSINATDSIGLYINSVAGRGGDGGRASGSSVDPGDGGDGGKGGNVAVNYSGSVATNGQESHGLFIQSRGGATGAVGSTGGSGARKHKSKAGDAGQGGAVTAALSDLQADTNGQGAVGVMVQSIGGFGSSGSNPNSTSASYGADGGSGGDAGAVNLTMTGSNMIRTKGNQSNAISALSVGGGGGSGAFSNGIFHALGGEGQAGGSGHVVTVSSVSTAVETQGAGSIGIIAASVGGGGGAGGSATSITSHGGSGGSGGDGGAVNVTFSGTEVTTDQSGSHGMVAASIGGGGGVAHNPSGLINAHGGSGGGGGHGGGVSYTSQDQGLTINTSGDNADGVALLSVGGGGGHGASTYDLSIFATHNMGGSGGDGGAGGNISMKGSAADDIHTIGNNSVGLAAITVGGGGGRSGSSTSISLLGSGPGNSHTPGLENSQGNSGGGDGNHGGDISGNFGGTITTEGASSTGVMLVSTGLGGGSAGTYTSVDVGARLSNTLGATGGGGGDGGDIDVTLDTTITTDGDHSAGIDALSVGGGGGHSSNVVNVTVGLDLDTSNQQGASGGSSGDSGDVTLASNGDITTNGELSAGISASSPSPGGG